MLLMQDNIFTGISISWQALHITATTTTKFQVHSKVIGIKIPLTLSKLELYSVLMWHFSLSLGRLICNIIIIKLFKRTISLVYIWYHTVVCGALVALGLQHHLALTPCPQPQEPSNYYEPYVEPPMPSQIEYSYLPSATAVEQSTASSLQGWRFLTI